MIDSPAKKVVERLQSGLDSALRLGASAAKIHYRQGDRLRCSFEAGRLKEIEAYRNVSYSIEVLSGRRKGLSAGNNLDDLDDLLSRAVALAGMGSTAHFSAYPPPVIPANVNRYAENTRNLSLETMIAACQNIANALKQYNPDMFICAEAARNVAERVLVTSGGVCHTSPETAWRLGAFAQRTQGTDMLFAGFGRIWREINEFFDPDYIVQRILQDLRRGEEIVEAPQGRVPVFLEPQGFGVLLTPVVLGVNGRNVAKGDSPLKGRLGQKVFDSSLTVTDNPHVNYAGGAAVIDGDGIPTQVVSIIRDGIVERFLYDLDSAGMAGVEPTGNSVCRPYSLEVRPGETPGDELLAGIEDGLYIKDLLGFGQGNIINGDFSCNVGLGFRIRDGRVCGRVKNTMVAGNIYDLLKENVKLSSDLDPVERKPSAVIQGVMVSGGR